MIQSRVPVAVSAAALTLLAVSPCRAEVQLFAPENLTAWADVRVTNGDGERGWLQGGFGKTRYGSGEGGAHLAQAAVLWQPRLADTVTAHVIAQYVPDAHKSFGIEEAFVKWKPVPRGPVRYGLRAGQFFPPVSLEHDGAGWTTTRTVTPSAINSWIGEEVLVQGLEATVQTTVRDHGLAATFAGFTGNDTAATILTWRGWAMHDIAASQSTGLLLPDGPQGWSTILAGGAQAARTKPVAEVDGRVGYYVRFDWRPPAAWAVNLTFYDNQGDSRAVRNGQWGWATRFYNLGVQYQPTQDWEILAQYMTGRSAMGWPVGEGRRAFDTDYDSAYVLAARRFGSGCLAGRIDYFAVKDRSWRSQDDNTEKGHAVTVAWTYPLNAHLDLAVEALHVQSWRPARTSLELDPRQGQTQVQLALKLHL